MIVAATWGPLTGGNVSQSFVISFCVKRAASDPIVVPLATCTRTLDLMIRVGAVVLVLDVEVVVVVVGVADDGAAARTMRKVAPMNSTTMIRTTPCEGWKCDPDAWPSRDVEVGSLISPTLERLDAIY